MSTEQLRHLFVPRVINMCYLDCACNCYCLYYVRNFLRQYINYSLNYSLFLYDFLVCVCVHVREICRAEVRLITFTSPRYLVPSNLIDSLSAGNPVALDFIQWSDISYTADPPPLISLSITLSHTHAQLLFHLFRGCYVDPNPNLNLTRLVFSLTFNNLRYQDFNLFSKRKASPHSVTAETDLCPHNMSNTHPR